MNKTGLSWWSDRAWLWFGWCVTAVITVLILLNWRTWSAELKLVAAIAALIPVHATEEWVFPGGFNFQYNTFLYRSARPDRYPMCRASDMITVLGVTIMYAVVAFAYAVGGGAVHAGVLMSAMAFSALEVVFHTYCGVRAYLMYRSKGKTTIYGPGSITAYLGFGVLGVLMFYSLRDMSIGASDWGLCALILAAIVCFCFIPEQAFKNKVDSYYFETNGYYDRFLK
ncbi:beta-carotene 15,15'-monooxygenase [Bifidobacterium eulemuris]|nr:beta-carotene 15,15'-monooxygenase [Bifidobacterium eulemuris]